MRETRHQVAEYEFRRHQVGTRSVTVDEEVGTDPDTGEPVVEPRTEEQPVYEWRPEIVATREVVDRRRETSGTKVFMLTVGIPVIVLAFVVAAASL